MSRYAVVQFFLAFTLLVSPSLVFAEVVRPITFPVQDGYTYRDDWHEPRDGGRRQHKGNDIFAAKMTPLIAVTDGIITFAARPAAPWGCEIEIQDSEGWVYDYLHVNNDTPGTDDGVGCVDNISYLPGVVRGAGVSRGAIIGWVGDSGNAENTPPHLHFEIRDPNNENVNPFPSLYTASGGKGVTASTPRIDNAEPTFEERKAELRHIFTKDLALESESNEVRQLQKVLKALGHFSYPSATGYFGPITETAVKSYQAKKKLPETGIIDLATRRKLNDDLGTYDPNDYQPFWSEAELRAQKIQALQQQIAILQKLLDQLLSARS